MENSSKQNILSMWLFWQFYEMPKFLLQIWNNYFIFATNYFSLTLLLKTFFSPWRGYRWKYPRGLDLQEFFNTLISNTFSRILGALMRIVLIITGIFLQIFVAVFGLIVFMAWLLVPFIVIAGFLFVFIY
jgi:hypothetical protein